MLKQSGNPTEFKERRQEAIYTNFMHNWYTHLCKLIIILRNMKKYFVLYMASEGDFKKAMGEMANVTPAEQEASMQEWKDWMESKGGVVDMGAPLGKTKRVMPSEISDMRNEIGGYSIIEAASHEDAAKKMQDSPHFKMMPGGWIEVMEVMPM
ncbi:MAG: hypothetical protein AAB388_01195 [Patescibacteria group bacterium]